MKIETRHVKYAFADVVGFTQERTVDAQVEIVEALNDSFRRAAGQWETVFLPTGDGICAGVIQADAPADAHLQIALRVLNSMHEWSIQAEQNRKCTLRFGVNESVDLLVVDINGQRNLAGAGINNTQRLMSVGDANQIIVGTPAYDTLSVRDDYQASFRRFRTEIKHGSVLTAYQFVGQASVFLNTELPWSVRRADSIDLDLTEILAHRENFNTSAQVRLTNEATRKWGAEMAATLDELIGKCNTAQAESLRHAQNSWETYWKAEDEFLGQLRGTIYGTMYRVLAAAVNMGLVRQRV